MIVLAIAGLVLAIVFIAVPALQRNSRDTQRRGDVGAIQGGITTYSGNNNGQIPSNAAELTTALTGIELNFYDGTIADAAASVPVAKTLVVGETFAPRTGTATDPAALTLANAEILADAIVLIPEAACPASGNLGPKATALAVGWTMDLWLNKKLCACLCLRVRS